MYSSWFKNDPEDEPVLEQPAERQPSSHQGSLWLIGMAATVFVLVGLAVFMPDPGLTIAICGLPVSAAVFTLWLLRILRV